MQGDENILVESNDGSPQVVLKPDLTTTQSTNSDSVKVTDIVNSADKVGHTIKTSDPKARSQRKRQTKTVEKSNVLSETIDVSDNVGLTDRTESKDLSDRASDEQFSGKEHLTIIYCRVSSSLQRTDGISLVVQEQTCREYARKNGWTIVKIVSEVCSAVNTAKQSGLLQILNSQKTFGGQTLKLLVYNVSRFSRNVSKGLELARKLRQRNIHLVSCMESFDLTTTSGEYTFTTLLNAAEFESRMIGQRVKDALAEKKRQGNTLGQAPFGWKAVTSLVEPKQQATDDLTSSSKDRDNNNNNNNKDEENSLKQDRVQVKKRTLVIDQTEQHVIHFIVACRSKGTKLQVISDILSRVTSVDLTEKPIILDPPTEQLLDPLSFQNIADLLNSYQVFPRAWIVKRGWNAQSVSRIYNRHKKKVLVSL